MGICILNGPPCITKDLTFFGGRNIEGTAGNGELRWSNDVFERSNSSLLPGDIDAHKTLMAFPREWEMVRARKPPESRVLRDGCLIIICLAPVTPFCLRTTTFREVINKSTVRLAVRRDSNLPLHPAEIHYDPVPPPPTARCCLLRMFQPSRRKPTSYPHFQRPGKSRENDKWLTDVEYCCLMDRPRRTSPSWAPFPSSLLIVPTISTPTPHTALKTTENPPTHSALFAGEFSYYICLRSGRINNE